MLFLQDTTQKKIHNDETAEPEVLHPSTHPSRRPSQPRGCSEQQSCQNETLRDKPGDICSARPWQDSNHRSHHSSVLPETHWPRPTWQPQSWQEAAHLGLAQNTLPPLRAPGITQALLRDVSDTASPAAAEGSKQTSLCKAATTAERDWRGCRNLRWAASPMTVTTEELLWGRSWLCPQACAPAAGRTLHEWHPTCSPWGGWAEGRVISKQLPHTRPDRGGCSCKSSS